MAIFAKNLIVGGVKLPTTDLENKNSLQRNKEPETVSEEVSHYLEKIDGELVRHINKKSLYLTDMIEI
jgi:hypothetical protein